MSTTIYQRVTSTILGQLEAGVLPWHKCWQTNTAGQIPAKSRE